MSKLKLELKSIDYLVKEHFSFFIPKYQRGYRWTEQQVKDLLDDIQVYRESKSGGIYCLQPLVVKGIPSENEEGGKWEVIDGQQRLTTIFILLSYLDSNSNLYELEYETRKGSWEFLQSLKNYNTLTLEELKKLKKTANENIDFFHMYNARKAIEGWFDQRFKSDKQKEKQAFQEKFLTTLRDCVKFIWYETDEKNPREVFKRLNSGRIPLTDAELIKALFLNQSNFSGNRSPEAIRLCQQEIAMEWDQIEYTLQNDEFWLFIHDDTWTKPTRIDFILDLVRERNGLHPDFPMPDNLENDEHQTFRYFYAYFLQNIKRDKESPEGRVGEKNVEWLMHAWRNVKRYFQIFKEWYDDLELYHYVGYLVAVNSGGVVSGLLDDWEAPDHSKQVFKNGIIKKIKDSIPYKNLNQSYDIGSNPAKTQCRPLLLLFNIQTIINQNKALADSEKYGLGAFYRFPFHLFKREKWDVEHVDSNTGNALDNKKDQQEWVKNIWFANQDKIKGKGALLQNICNFLDGSSKQTVNEEELVDELEKLSEESRPPEGNRLNDKQKQMVWNFVLLDQGTNRSYGNDLFQTKRRKIIGKDSGKLIELQENLPEKTIALEPKEGLCAFVPPCTKNVFLKYYTSARTNLDCWSLADAEEYKKAILDTLENFEVYDSSKEEGMQ